MFKFENDILLWLLVVIPIICWLKYSANRKTKTALACLGDIDIVNKMSNNVSVVNRNIRFVLRLLALVLIVMAMARPIAGSSRQSTEKSNVEVLVAIDVSNSMMAEDVMPSRLEKSKIIVNNIIDKLSNHKVGLIVYAGDAFIQVPINSDMTSTKFFLQSVSPSMIESQGTNIGAALRLASASFGSSGDSRKAIILITDGENHEEGAATEAQDLKNKGIELFVLGVGTTAGSNIPDGNDWLKDSEGNNVVSKVNKAMCQEIAEKANGTCFFTDEATNVEGMISKAIDDMQTGRSETIVYDKANEQFQAFALIALILMVISVVWGNRLSSIKDWFAAKQRVSEDKERQRSNFRMGDVYSQPSPKDRNEKFKTLLILLSFTFISSNICAQSCNDFIRKGNKEYRKGNYKEAEINYRKALNKDKTSSTALYNLGCAMMKNSADMRQIDSIKAVYDEALRHETKAGNKSKCWYNKGVLYQDHKHYDEAIDCYKNALRQNPNNEQARYNLAKCQYFRKKQSNHSPKQSNSGNDDKKKNKDEKDKNNENNKSKRSENEQNNISKDNANQLLSAALREEQKTQQRLQQAKRQTGERRKYKNNW